MGDRDDGDFGDTGFDERIGDDLYRAVSNRDRTYALAYLLEHESATLDELADVVTAWSNVPAGTPATRTERDRRRTQLHHRHLPILERAGLVRYDAGAKEVVLLTVPQAVVDLLSRSLTAEGGGEPCV